MGERERERETDESLLSKQFKQSDEVVTTAQVHKQISDHLIALTHTHTLRHYYFI